MTTEHDRTAVLANCAMALDALRDELGISIPDLADRIDRDRTHLWRVLNGQATLTADIAARLLREMGNIVEYRAAAGERTDG